MKRLVKILAVAIAASALTSAWAMADDFRISIRFDSGCRDYSPYRSYTWYDSAPHYYAPRASYYYSYSRECYTAPVVYIAPVHRYEYAPAYYRSHYSAPCYSAPVYRSRRGCGY